eukprot:Hpha_TRINITY_DN16023_c9_g1::TRINITY_DN16023_c9_g1_i1::g.120046::m.120046
MDERQWSAKHNKYHFSPGEKCVLRYSITGTCFATVLDMRVEDPSSGVAGKIRLRVQVPKDEARHSDDGREMLVQQRPTECSHYPPSVLSGTLDLLHGLPSDTDHVLELPLLYAESQLRPVLEVSKRLKGLEDFPGMERFVSLHEPKAIAVGPERSDGSPQAWSVGAYNMGAKTPQQAEKMAAERCVGRQLRGARAGSQEEERVMVDLVWRAAWGPVPQITAPLQLAIERRWVLGEWRSERELPIVGNYLQSQPCARQLWEQGVPGSYAEEERALLTRLSRLQQNARLSTNGRPAAGAAVGEPPPSPPGVQRPPPFAENEMVEIIEVPLAPNLRGAVAVVKQVCGQRLRLLVPEYPGTPQHEVSLRMQHVRQLDREQFAGKYEQRKADLERSISNVMAAAQAAAQASAAAAVIVPAPDAPETDSAETSPPPNRGKKELRPGAAPFVSAGTQQRRRQQSGGEDSPPQTGSFFTRLGSEDGAKDAFSQMARRAKEEERQRQASKAQEGLEPGEEPAPGSEMEKAKNAELQQEWLQVIAEQKRKTAKRKAEGVTYSQMAGMIQPQLCKGADSGRKPFAAGRGRPVALAPSPAT